MNDCSVQQRWVAIVYDGCDKIGSHIFYGHEESDVHPEATQWIRANYGQGTDWSLHHIVDQI